MFIMYWVNPVTSSVWGKFLGELVNKTYAVIAICSLKVTRITPLVSNYRSTLKLIFRLLMSKKAFLIKHYCTLILPDETKYHTFWALCLEQLSSITLLSSYLQATLCFSILCYLEQFVWSGTVRVYRPRTSEKYYRLKRRSVNTSSGCGRWEV